MTLNPRSYRKVQDTMKITNWFLLDSNDAGAMDEPVARRICNSSTSGLDWKPPSSSREVTGQRPRRTCTQGDRQRRVNRHLHLHLEHRTEPPPHGIRRRTNVQHESEDPRVHSKQDHHLHGAAEGDTHLHQNPHRHHHHLHGDAGRRPTRSYTIHTARLGSPTSRRRSGRRRRGIRRNGGGLVDRQAGSRNRPLLQWGERGCFGAEGSGRASASSGKGKGCQGQVKVSYGFSLIRGKTNHPMEDFHVAELAEVKGNELGLFAIYDGHLGDTVPAYLQKNLFPNILNEEEFWTHPDRALTKAYEKTDQAILSHTPDLGPGGSTAVTAILINGRKLWVANVGDSRAVLLKGGEAIQMSIDHDPNVERGAIENRGGFVSNMPGDVPRVCGQLAVSRAFGDRNLKSLLKSEPDVTVEDIDHTAELVVLASDGVWKVMNNREAVDVVKRFKDPQTAAKQLIAEAVKRESKDDISCVVVRFKM